MAYRTVITIETDTLGNAQVLAAKVALELGELHCSGVQPTTLVIEHFDPAGHTAAVEVAQVESTLRP